MKKLDPSFDMDAEMEKANAYVAKGMKKNKTSAMIAIPLTILILGGAIALILHILDVF